MTTTQFIPFCAAIGICLTGSFASAEDSAADIARKFETEKAAALEAYLAANAEAKDRDEALDLLIGSRMFLGESEKLTPLLKQRYDSLEKGPGADLNVLIGQVVRPLVDAYKQSGDKKGALAFIAQVRKDLSSHPAAQQINQFFDTLEAQLNQPGVGDTMEIAFTATNGEEIDLAKMKDKVVLVDFWATWCGPCVAELPNVISAYEKYKEKGFEIIGISLDQDKGAMDGFIKERKAMDWPQYFDGKGWENEISTKFGIGSIPATFLIGKDGKIAAADLRGKQLEEKLAELLD